MSKAHPETAGRNQAGRFLAGSSGNPRGRPRGARHRTTLVAEALLEGQAEAITQKAIEAALDGDPTALRLCLERIAPVRRGRPVEVDLGRLSSPADLTSASLRLLDAVASGGITPEEAQAVGRVVETARRAIETEELEMRIAALEADGRGG